MEEGELSKLNPDARSRVEEAMKRAIESEIARAATGVAGDELMAHSRSKGFFFSRSKTTDALKDRINPVVDLDRALLRNVESLDDAAFSRFADRLSKLRDMKPSK
ncbi:hypothetical protein [Sphingomonas pituitosa]|uniref:hypothetical protein n=1 Tax=Sphingomonas pituitosa TaxID=99597 RepID=UPI000A6820AF|nr:hypothetical protein [Sphingomonas pituitosa]